MRSWKGRKSAPFRAFCEQFRHGRVGVEMGQRVAQPLFKDDLVVAGALREKLPRDRVGPVEDRHPAPSRQARAASSTTDSVKGAVMAFPAERGWAQHGTGSRATLLFPLSRCPADCESTPPLIANSDPGRLGTHPRLIGNSVSRNPARSCARCRLDNSSSLGDHHAKWVGDARSAFRLGEDRGLSLSTGEGSNHRPRPPCFALSANATMIASR